MIFAARASLGKLWGPTPKMMLWLYKAVIRPMHSYGSILWTKAVVKHLKPKLRTLQRLALLNLGHFRNGTPMAGLEVITDLMPIDLFIEKEALNTYCKLKPKLL